MNSNMEHCCICYEIFVTEASRRTSLSTIIDILRILIVKINPKSLEDFSVCETCLVKVQSAYKFKTLYLDGLQRPLTDVTVEEEMDSGNCIKCEICKTTDQSDYIPVFDSITENGFNLIKCLSADLESKIPENSLTCEMCHKSLINFYDITNLLMVLNPNHAVNINELYSETDEKEIQGIDNDINCASSTENFKVEIDSLLVDLKNEKELANFHEEFVLKSEEVDLKMESDDDSQLARRQHEKTVTTSLLHHRDATHSVKKSTSSTIHPVVNWITDDIIPNPVYDIICLLLEIPYSQRTDKDRRDIMISGRPTPQLNMSKPDRKYGQTFSRSFKSQWYTGHQWLCGSYYMQRLFCWPCLLLANGRNNTWVSQGFFDLKNLSAGIKKHELSKEHMSSYLTLKRLENNFSNIQNPLELQSSLKSYNEEVRKNRNLLSYLIDVTCHLVKQELSFRGYGEKNDSDNAGSFHETFNLIIKRDLEIQEHLKKIASIFSDLSKTIQNDLIGCVFEHLMDTIHGEIKESLVYAVQADDTTDILEKSQCAISVRFVNTGGEIKERFLGFYDVSEDRSADALYKLITSVLSPFDCKNKLVGQCYNGASMMVGSLNFLEKKTKDEDPTALFAHCSAHRLNLILQNGSKNIKNCHIYFATLASIPGFFHQSAKRTFVLDSVIGKINPSSSNTRWSSRSKIINVLDSNWEGLKNVFEKIIDDTSSAAESINGAMGYLKLMNDLEFSFLTTVHKKIFDITDLLFDILQKKSLDIVYCKEQVFLARDRIKLLRNESTFDELFANAAQRVNCDSVAPDKRIKLSDVIKDDEKASLRSLFCEIIDNIVKQIEVRFADLSKVLYFSLADSSKFKEYRKKFPIGLVMTVSDLYKSYLDKQKLTNELGVIYDDDQFEKLNIESMIKVFVDNKFQEVFPESYKLFVLIATIPLTSTFVERHFSCLKRIRTYNKNSVNNERLSSLALMSIEKELFYSLEQSNDFTDTIINKFSLLKDTKINLNYRK